AQWSPAGSVVAGPPPPMAAGPAAAVTILAGLVTILAGPGGTAGCCAAGSAVEKARSRAGGAALRGEVRRHRCSRLDHLVVGGGGHDQAVSAVGLPVSIPRRKD